MTAHAGARLWVDDLQEPPGNDWVRVKTSRQALGICGTRFLEESGRIPRADGD